MKTTLEELQAFVAVVDGGSITAAADHLDQTVSGISRALARLEKKLDTTLLRRTTRRTALTEEGHAFLQRTRAILASIEDAEEHMAARRQQPAGRLRVNAATPFMLHARPLCTSRLRVLASPEYLARAGRPKSVADLAGHTLLGVNQPESLNRWPLRGTHGDEWPIVPSLTASSGETLRQLALAHVGLVCLSDFMTAADRESGRLVQVLARDTVEVRQPINAVYYRNTQLAARIACFLDFLQERMGG